VFGFHKSSKLKIYISGYVARDHSHKMSMGEGQLRALINLFKLIDDYFPGQKSDRSNIEISNIGKYTTQSPTEEEIIKLTNDLRSKILAHDGNWIVVGGPKNNIAAALCFESIKHSNIGFNLSSNPISITRPEPDLPVINDAKNSNEHYCWILFLTDVLGAKRNGLLIAGIDTFGTDAAALYLKSNWIKCHIKRISLKWKNKKTHTGSAFLIKYKRFDSKVKDVVNISYYSIPKNEIGTA